MKDRLAEFLNLEQLSPSKFADLIGVQRSSVSHVISGRNKPSFDFLQKTLKAIPGLNPDWLILGEGSMYRDTGEAGSRERDTGPAYRGRKENPSRDLFSQMEAEPVGDLTPPGELSPPPGTDRASGKEPHAGTSGQSPKPPEQAPGHSGTGLRVIQVLVFYEDRTFTSYRPAE